ncbi:hypothetical protein EDD63_1265 [Breznakia blatticola]|uniref:Uncharacterized protein n=1 Tax=Breznakia blatticola TaxID=1754012 RepID=A0A4R7ZIH7_9FIRM|nr:hypothetical protein [Breznakia blatticola]TDW16241.1 hypothetical protein EDD63_1265 [Breznakia blatticola]
MSADKYIFDPAVVTRVIKEQRHVRSELQEIYKSAIELRSKIDSGISWKGKQKDVLLNMLDAVILYHGDVTGGKDGKNNSPYDALISALTNLEKSLNVSVNDIPAYKEISKV